MLITTPKRSKRAFSSLLGLIRQAGHLTYRVREAISTTCKSALAIQLFVEVVTEMLISSMFADLDHAQPDVQEDILNWGTWIGSTLKINGLRLDACKHISRRFLQSFIHHVSSTVGKDWFFIAEYWDTHVETLIQLIHFFGRRVSFFDVPLVYNLSAASKTPHHFDLRRVFKGTLCGSCPSNTVVSNALWKAFIHSAALTSRFNIRPSLRIMTHKQHKHLLHLSNRGLCLMRILSFY